MNERPISTLIFGILNIAFGLWDLASPLLAALFAHLKFSSQASVSALQSDPAYVALTKFSVWTSVVFGVALVAFGIGLLLLKNWARLGSIVFAVVDIVFVAVGSVLGWSFMKVAVEQAMAQAHGAPVGLIQGMATLVFVLTLIIRLAYPALLLLFMTRANVIEACQRTQPATAA